MQIDGGYAHQSEGPARHRRAAYGENLAGVFGWRAGMVRALWDDVLHREGGSNGAKVASGGSDRRGTYVLGGGEIKKTLKQCFIIDFRLTFVLVSRPRPPTPHAPTTIVGAICGPYHFNMTI